MRERVSDAPVACSRIVAAAKLLDRRRFVRAAVWDHLHGRHMSAFDGDVDVVWFDRARWAEISCATEAELAAKEPSFRWSVKNQAWAE
jgi:hypothetical protein